MKALALLLATGCAGGWVASTTPHVTVYTEARIEHEWMQEWLELSRAAYRAFFPNVDPGHVDAVWLKNEPGSGTRVYGLLDDPRSGWTLAGLPSGGRIGQGGLIVLERLDDARATRDEGLAKRQMAHLFIMRAVPTAPLWLQVGLSHYLAKFRIHYTAEGKWTACFGGAVFDEPPEINLVPLARSGRRVSRPIDELLATDWYDYDRKLRDWYEYTAYALVHYLIHGLHQGRFPILLRALAEGKSSDEALALAYPDVLDDEWDDRLDAWMRPPPGAALLAATPTIQQGICLPIPPQTVTRPRRLAADGAEVQQMLDDLTQVDIFRRHAGWFPRDIVDAEAARHPRPRHPGPRPPAPTREPDTAIPTVVVPGR